MDRPKGLKVLIVEDDKMIGNMIRQFLEGVDNHYSFFSATDGDEAWDICKREKPDIVITDIMMPRMDGIALITLMRSNPEFAVTPIIAVTAGDDDMKQAAAYAGAHLVLPKPIPEGELLAAVDSLLRISPFIKKSEG
jgi:DNA-binding response OmpR family regulator